jgi:hypothetical protein
MKEIEMSKINEYMSGRNDGMLLALKTVKEGGIEALEKEIKFRNITKLPSHITKAESDKIIEDICNYTITTVGMLSLVVLYDEFDFRAKRLQRFLDRYKWKAECLMTPGIITWKELIDDLEERTGMKFDLCENFKRDHMEK